MNRYLKLSFFFSALGLSTLSLADAERCDQHFPNGVAPVVQEATRLKTSTLCFSRFAVVHSGTTRGPLIVAEHLTARDIKSAKEQVRVNLFHPEPRLSRGNRSELRDYARSGYDRGHMAPSGNMPDADAQAVSFSLANMVPQDPQNNRYVWEAIESSTRAYVQRQGEAFVLTGPLFLGKQIESIGAGVLVPTHLFKLVYDPVKRATKVYLTENNGSKSYAVISARELQAMTRVELPQSVLDAASALKMPEPRARSDRGSGTRNRQSTYVEDPTIGERALRLSSSTRK